MEEKVLIRGKSKNYGVLPIILLLVGVGILAYFFIEFNNNKRLYVSLWGVIEDTPITLALFFIAIVAIIFAVYGFFLSKCEIVVTDKRVYGSAAFGKQVDLPIDSITAVGASAFNGIAVASSSGRIVFRGITNRDSIRAAISDLLMARQEKRNAPTTIKQEIPKSDADEIKKYKELLDSGIITQEEFDKKKKQLLGL